MPDKRPNILFVQTDQQRPEMGGDERGFSGAHSASAAAIAAPGSPTPSVRRLSALLRATAWWQERSMTAPGCGAHDTYPPDNLPKYHRRLRDEAGYHVMAAGKHHVGNSQSGNPRQQLPCRLSRGNRTPAPGSGVFRPERMAHGLRRPLQAGSRLRSPKTGGRGRFRANAHSTRRGAAPSAPPAPVAVRPRAQRKGRRVLRVP